MKFLNVLVLTLAVPRWLHSELSKGKLKMKVLCQDLIVKERKLYSNDMAEFPPQTLWVESLSAVRLQFFEIGFFAA